MYAYHLHEWWVLLSEETVRSFEAGVTEDYKLSDVGDKNQT